jgi:hypothetical protein
MSLLVDDRDDWPILRVPYDPERTDALISQELIDGPRTMRRVEL